MKSLQKTKTNRRFIILYKKLKEDGHKIYIITGRNNGEYTNPNELTTQWLDNYDIVYDKLIFTNAYDKHAKQKYV